jgi:GT2 family glycosyltransferase
VETVVQNSGESVGGQVYFENAPTLDLSVIIVSWNARDYLVQCLNSLSSDVCRYPMEIIVVDNASSDGSPESVEQGFPNVRLIRNEANLGFAKANNLGIAQSRGRYLALINSDVKVLPDCITRLVDYCAQHPEAGMVGPRILGGDGKLQRSCHGFPNLWNMFCRGIALDSLFPHVRLFGGYLMPYWDHDNLRPVDILSGCFWLVRREALLKVGLLDEGFFMYGEDMDWCRRFWVNDWQVVFIPGAEAIHYGGASSANAPVRFFIEKQRANLRYWKKHHSWFAQQCFFLILCLEQLLRMLGYAAAWCGQTARAQEHRLKLTRGFQCLLWLLSPETIAAVAAGKKSSQV